MTTRLKCILLDDEIPGLTYLKMLCEQIPELEIVKAYNDPQKFITDAPSLDFGLCILDIEMPKLNGTQVASFLRDKLIIFTTAYKEYAADAFDLDAVDFVQKPVTKSRLQTAVNKAIDRHDIRNQRKQYVNLNTDKGKTLIDVARVAYITTSDVDSRDKVAVMLDGSSLVLKNISFETLLTYFPANQFCRTNKRQVIALKIVASFTASEITTNLHVEESSIKIPLSDKYRLQFLQAIDQLS